MPPGPFMQVSQAAEMRSPFVVIYARGHPLWSMFYTIVPCSTSTLSTAWAMTVYRFWNSQPNTAFCIWSSSVTLGNCHWRDDSSHPGTVLSGTASIIGQTLLGCQLLRYSTTSTTSIHREGHFIRPVNSGIGIDPSVADEWIPRLSPFLTQVLKGPMEKESQVHLVHQERMGNKLCWLAQHCHGNSVVGCQL